MEQMSLAAATAEVTLSKRVFDTTKLVLQLLLRPREKRRESKELIDAQQTKYKIYHQE